MVQEAKPVKPYADFPLTAHPTGRWCKKIRGKIHYFGPWHDWQAALNLYQEQRDDLHAGRKPRGKGDGHTVGEVADRFLYSKKSLLESGELSSRAYADYDSTCGRVVASVGKNRLITDLDTGDFQELRKSLAKGLKGKAVGPHRLKGEISRTRSFLLYAVESGLCEKPLRYRTELKAPSQKIFRKLANAIGPRMFDRKEILAMLLEASPSVKGMIYLGINCGFGNHDCATLPQAALDLDKGWHNHPRPKTHNQRRCPLWPETIEALREAISERPENKIEAENDLVFITKYGYAWGGDESRAISFEFRKIMKELGIYRKGVTTFYSLRRTLETIGAAAGQQVALDFIMGHCPEADDMASIYRQKQFDKPLLKVSNHVRAWLLGTKRIS